MQVKTMAASVAAGETPDILFWVGCAGSCCITSLMKTKKMTIPH